MKRQRTQTPSHIAIQSRRCIDCLLVIAFVSLLSTGCQSTNTLTSSVREAGIAPGLQTSASKTPSASAERETTEVVAEGATSPNADVQQVGFAERLAARRACGPCNEMEQCGDCMEACGPGVTSPMIQLGRPVDPQEFLCNGGDKEPTAYLISDDTITGLQAQDAVVHYTTEAGDIEFQASNRVCLYSPRFGSIRQISGAVAGEKAIGPRNTALPVGLEGLNLNQPSLVAMDIDELGHANVARRLDAVRDRNRGVPVNQSIEPVIAEDVLEILATLDSRALQRLDESQIALLEKGSLAARSWMIRDAVEVMIESILPPTLIRDQSVEALVVYDFPDAGRLEIVKVADRDHAALGEEVQFAIHVRNVGDSVVRNVQIADSLLARLEYVEGSQESTPESAFEARGNEAGSVKLLWTLKEPMEVGESATIKFRCKVR
ncbi:MAG: DUF11 domain-containing protein [Planctomycetota bacterium]